MQLLAVADFKEYEYHVASYIDNYSITSELSYVGKAIFISSSAVCRTRGKASPLNGSRALDAPVEKASTDIVARPLSIREAPKQ